MGQQLPMNPSISMTLEAAMTTTEVTLQKKSDQNSTVDFNIYLDGALKPSFKPKLEQFFARIINHFPWLVDYHLTIQSIFQFFFYLPLNVY